jgi:hypothetical protein
MGYNCKCLHCSKNFTSKRSNKKYCSIDCYQTYRKETSLTKEEKKQRAILHQVKFKYNLNEDEYKTLIQKSKGKCMICSKSFKNVKDRHIDHCHTTKKIRGVLCSSCNQGLGYFKDSPVLLQQAVTYLLANCIF